MKQAIKDYIKCAYVNKFTLAGFISLAAGIGLTAMGKSSEYEAVRQSLLALTYHAALSCFLPTFLGMDTFMTYRKSRKYIKEFGKIKESYQEIKSQWYCSRVAIELAAKEAGLEATLENGGETK